MMTYKSFVKEHKTLKSQILKEENNLKTVATNEEIKFVQEKISKTCRVTQCKMDKIKDRKLENLKKAATDNLPNEDIQILNADNNIQHKRSRRKINNKKKRSAKAKRRRRQGKLKKKEQELIEKLKNIELPPEDRFRLYDNTDYEMTDIEMQVCAKGLKFVPSVKRVDRHQKHLDFDRFSRLLRLGLYFHRRGNDYEYEEYPWTPKSTWDPPRYLNEKLEEYLDEVYSDLFSPDNIRKVPDNLTWLQKAPLKSLSKWNYGDTNRRMFGVQDKGARLCIEWKERYKNKVEDYLQDTKIFRQEDQDRSDENQRKVIDWANKWHDKEVISEEEMNWIIPAKVKPGNVYPNPKAHKEGLPYRYIISARGTAMEKLARWSEFKLKSHAKKHPAYLKDTTDFLKCMEDINIRKGPFDEMKTVLSTRDVENYYPSCDKHKYLQAIEKVLSECEEIIISNSNCILEAIELTMTSNNCSFLGKHFTQIEPAFPDIKKILLRHQHIILDDDELKKVFPNGAKDFQVSERREAKNIKELFAESKIATLEVEDQNGGSQPCNKNCAYCEILRKTTSHEFKSSRTGYRYKIRQNITCESKDIVYLVTCNKHNIQGVRCTTDLKSRISNDIEPS